MVQFCSADCASTLEATSDGGKSWNVVTSPSAAASGVRFASVSEGYAWVEPDYGGGSSSAAHSTTTGAVTLYATHDGGQTWQPTALTEPVATVATVANEDWAFVGSCPNQNFAACSDRRRPSAKSPPADTWPTLPPPPTPKPGCCSTGERSP